MASEANSDPCVWISTTVNNINEVQGTIRREFGKTWRAEHSPEDVEWSKRMVRESDLGWKRGDILTKEQVGDVWYFNTHPEYTEPPFINGGGYPLVSESAKAVLEQFDLGETVFHPLTLMDSGETRLSTPEPYYLLNVGNKRSMGNYEALGPEGEVNAPLVSIANGVVYLPSHYKEAQLVVNPDALTGPDIWLDPKVPSLLFLSDQLVTGLKEAGMDKGWGLVRCAVGTL
ncbi:imm11 family protein [Ruegeria arenilitoris]|uniref:imm11 family protein n=1 Tax=Ruegeria arenilitoris TaxID=1173585 RepID=UPI001480DBE7|nr:DUF1629 domain-containing protein [Ruegeria arenilitoris]